MTEVYWKKQKVDAIQFFHAPKGVEIVLDFKNKEGKPNRVDIILKGEVL